ncbi:MAG: hypothetical protein LBU38_04510 [Propionibacteriaceae bacterium]|jgi:hypothetical protein|nr:hypothetical protein [Propionibacteriaceae bacterium]
MGFLDRLAKGAIGDALKGVTDSAGEAVARAVTGATGLTGSQPQAYPTSGSIPGQSDSGHSPSSPVAGKRGKAYFAQILAQDFADLTVREDVPVTELNGTGKPYDFGLYRESQLIAVVVLVEHNRDNNRAYLGGKNAAAAAGIPFINFYLHMPNEHGFVVGRIRRFL